MSSSSDLFTNNSKDEDSSGQDTKRNRTPSVETMFDENQCMIPANAYTEKCNRFLLKKEMLEREELTKNPDENDFLYPSLNDPNFNVKIAEKKEFNDTKYDGSIVDIKEHADTLSKADFQLAPHQAFVRNFMSFQTPYNSLLLFHGLGSGKTLSAIGVCEEMRLYMKQMGIVKRIIIVASPNVQDNFRLQLFDERNLKSVDGKWTMRDAIGNQLLREINPTGMKGLTKEKIVSQISTMINSSYLFMGYIELANYIQKVRQVKGDYKSEKERRARIMKNMQNEFDNRLIVVDEVHNIRISDDDNSKRVAETMLELVKTANHLRLLLLSATPLYNSYQEIVWLLNLMNINDRRGTIDVKDVFDKDGNFKKDKKGVEVGTELLIQKANGYVSFVRGENPYTFPFRVYPDIFAPEMSFSNPRITYPRFQMNGRPIDEKDRIQFLKLYLVEIGEYQSKGYQYIVERLKRQHLRAKSSKSKFKEMESFGYTLLQTPIAALNIIYPIEGLDAVIEGLSPLVSSSSPTQEQNKSSSFQPVVARKLPRLKIVDEEPNTNEPPGESQEQPQEPIRPSSTFEPVIARKKPRMRIVDSSEEPSEMDEAVELLNQPSSDESVTSYPYPSEVVGQRGGSNGSSSSSSSSSASVPKEIDVHDLTGKQGLERIMKFIDTKSPPVKGSFEYKTQTYGRIFSPSEIGKYSSKIKNICENIVSSTTGQVSEGVILVYSQYIEGGAIPVALALEEMGMIRHSQEGSKNLFASKPTPVVDVRTFQPKEPDAIDFIPARYALITGDSRLSPNNAAEVKACTNNANKDGNKVKVIIISQAGAEGVDFKFLRQVHILQPWYNVSRIEQIIGRAVRNFSHKELPFEKRNVEIFMYGTLLSQQDDGSSSEEAADMYIYRLAEFKATQIGKVTRVLKETAVDCIINHDQMNFTQEVLAGHKEGTVKQILSNGMEVNDFQVGDAPYSAACDFMENCNFKCIPKDTPEVELNENTYNEAFIMVNSEKIIQKIRLLMRERLFYKKKDLIYMINTPTPYPLVQIYAALTQLIESTNEHITDRYGRLGSLVNIGEYYMFQPTELNNTDISLFERSVPIDFKHSMVNFDISPHLENESIHDEEAISDGASRTSKGTVEPHSSERDDTQNEPKILKEIKASYETAMAYFKSNDKVPRGDDDFYKHCGITMRKLVNSEDFEEEEVVSYLTHHIVDSLIYRDKLELLNYLYSLRRMEDDSIESKMKRYMDESLITTETNRVGIVMFMGDKRKMLVLNRKKHKFQDAEPEDELEIARGAVAKFKIPAGLQFNSLVGFIDNEKSNRYLVFKTKQKDAKRNTGARCDEAVKAKKLQVLNAIMGEPRYTKENTKGMVQAELCSLQEFLLRHFNKQQKDDKIWFLNFEEAKLYNL
jgi:hypothetical protein